MSAVAGLSASELKEALDAALAENADLRAQLAWVISQSSAGYARGSIRRPGDAR